LEKRGLFWILSCQFDWIFVNSPQGIQGLERFFSLSGKGMKKLSERDEGKKSEKPSLIRQSKISPNFKEKRACCVYFLV